jgi:hypothetical protein
LSFFNPAAGRIHGDGWGFKGIAPPQDLILRSLLSNVKNGRLVWHRVDSSSFQLAGSRRPEIDREIRNKSCAEMIR